MPLIEEQKDGARLVIVHQDEYPYAEVRVQMHGERRVGVHLKNLIRTPEYVINIARYDPGMIIERHGHMSSHVIYVIDGFVDVGGHDAHAGSMILLEQGAEFGPLIAGPQGSYLFEVYLGDAQPVPADPDGFLRLLASSGVELLPHPVFEEGPGLPTNVKRGKH